MTLSKHALEMRKYRKNHPEYRKSNKDWTREYYRKLRSTVLNHYCNGDVKCASCGFSDVRALCLDHLENGAGTEHRKIIKRTIGNTGHYIWIIKNNFPPHYQVLCMNCNHIKGVEYARTRR